MRPCSIPRRSPDAPGRSPTCAIPSAVHRRDRQRQQRDVTATSASTHYTQYLDLQRGTTSFAQMAAFSERPLAVGEGVSAQERRVGVVSASFALDAPPGVLCTGRGRHAAWRGCRGARRMFWQSALGRGAVLGQSLTVGNVNATIVGVAPRGFNGVNDADRPALYLPITTFAGLHGDHRRADLLHASTSGAG